MRSLVFVKRVPFSTTSSPHHSPFLRRDLYELLGLSPKSTSEDIKSRYRTLALKYHPDRAGEKEKFLRVKEAYEVLSDP